MKKTLIALIALAGVTVGAESEQAPLTLTFTKDISATVSMDDFGVSGVELSGDTTACLDAGDFKKDYLRPNTNVDSLNTTWTLAFTLENNTGSDFVVDTIAIDAFSFTGGGLAQNNNRNFLFTVTAGETIIANKENLYIVGSDQANGGNSEGTLTLNLANSLTIASKGSLEFSITVNQGAFPSTGGGNGRGSFIGLSGMTFTSQPIPEPTTATLSLLALAGLAARRRRK